MLGVKGAMDSGLRGDCNMARLADADGGGDLIRGGSMAVVIGPILEPLPDLCTFCGSFVKSVAVGDWSCGAPVADIARCMAAAEGIVGMLLCGARWGLKSWLFFLDLDMLAVLAVPTLCGGRMGEASREVWGEVKIGDREEGRGLVEDRLGS